MTKKQILKAAESLDKSDRIAVANRLIASVESDEQTEIDEAWVKVAYARLDALKRGETYLVDGDKALDRIYTKYAR